RPFVGIAKYSAYVQLKNDGKPNTFWQKMPEHMIGKVSEAIAIRKAFPQETSGIYTRDEMGDDAVAEAGPMLASSRPEPESIQESRTFKKPTPTVHAAQDSTPPDPGQGQAIAPKGVDAPEAQGAVVGGAAASAPVEYIATAQ